MKANIVFSLEFAEGDKLHIKCVDVSGDGVPLSIFMSFLSAVVDVQDRVNGEDQPYVYVPVLGAQGSKPATDRIIQKYIEGQPSISPPHALKTVVTTNKMRKAYTEEEKNEIAQLYQDGRPVAEIARKFGRPTGTVYKIVSGMGVKRSQKREYKKPEVIAASDASEQPKAKRDCTLKKPWYLQSQKPNNKDKVRHE